MLRKINPVIQTVRPSSNGQVKSYPCGSVPVWKLLAELVSLPHGGCSQCGAAMLRSEGASQQYSGGWRLGLTVARTPALTVKRSPWFLPMAPGVSKRLPRRATRVLRVATWRKWWILRTIEDPRRSGFGWITPSYKAVPKRSADAAVSGTSRLRPALWGSQLGQSRGSCESRKAVPMEVRPDHSTMEQLALRLKPQSARELPLQLSTRSSAKQHSATVERTQRGRLASKQALKDQR